MKNKITLVKKEQWFNMKKLNYVDLMPKSSIKMIPKLALNKLSWSNELVNFYCLKKKLGI